MSKEQASEGSSSAQSSNDGVDDDDDDEEDGGSSAHACALYNICGMFTVVLLARAYDRHHALSAFAAAVATTVAKRKARTVSDDYGGHTRISNSTSSSGMYKTAYTTSWLP